MDIVTYGALNKKVGEKLSSNQGSDNAGKMLGINNEGEIQPIEVLGGNVSVTETLESGEDYSMTIEEGEPTAVTSVAGKYGAVTLNGGDIGYSPIAEYSNGTIGKTVQGLDENVFDLQQDVDSLGGDNIPLDSTDVQSETIKVAVDDLKARIPTPPNTDGTYTLQANVSSGTVTYIWVSAI